MPSPRKKVKWSELKPSQKFYTKWTSMVLKNPQYGMDWKPIKELKFHPKRRWRFDYAWPIANLAVEIDGFGFGHQSQQSIMKQNEKRNSAILLGWRVLVFDSRTLGAIERVEISVEMTIEAICLFSPEITRSKK